MLQWILANLATILVCAALAAMVGGIVRYLIGQKKRGKSACGCNCAGCAMAGKCHSAQQGCGQSTAK